MCTVLLPPGDNPIVVNKYIVVVSLELHFRILWLLVSNELQSNL